MAKDTNLTAQEIYDKEFHVDLKGYAPGEVDEFLDMVIEDYQGFEEKCRNSAQLWPGTKTGSRNCSSRSSPFRPRTRI